MHLKVVQARVVRSPLGSPSRSGFDLLRAGFWSLFITLGLLCPIQSSASSVVIDLQGLPDARLVGRASRPILMRLRESQIQHGYDLFLDRLQVVDDGRVRLFFRFIEISNGRVLGVGSSLRIDLDSLDEYNRLFSRISSVRVSRTSVAALFVAVGRPHALLGPNPQVTGTVDPVADFNLENGTLYTWDWERIFPRTSRPWGDDRVGVDVEGATCSSYFAGESERAQSSMLVDSMLEP